MNSDITTSDQLKKLIDSEHDLYKSEWDKKNVVQFKNERIAILKNSFQIIIIIFLNLAWKVQHW